MPVSLREAGSLTKRLTVAALFLIFALLVPNSVVFSHAQSTPSFYVESNQVLVPTYVYDKKLIWEPFPKTGGPEFDSVLDLTAKDFHLFEDDQEQRIQSVTLQLKRHYVLVVDNIDAHNEFAQIETPTGRWSSAGRLDSEPTAWEWDSLPDHSYLIAYVPPASAPGSCHRIDVRVDRPNSVVFARSQYCNVKHASFDPLNGTKFSKQMEGYAASGQAGKVNLAVQASVFYKRTDAALVDIALEFPWDSLKREWTTNAATGHGSPIATIGTLGLLYKKDGTLAARFSDFGCCSSDRPPDSHWRRYRTYTGFYRGPHPSEDPFYTPSRYETQIDLPPGEYNLQVVLSDGSKFGRVEAPLVVDSYDGKRLAISSVMLCKRFRDASGIAKEHAKQDFAPQYLPLVSNGLQFTPAGDTRFKKGDPLFAYFEVYEPLLNGTSATSVQTRLKLIDVRTGAVKVDTGPRSAADRIQPGKSVIPIAEQIAVDKLPKGSYRLEVQATDSGGTRTVWRTANFTVE